MVEYIDRDYVIKDLETHLTKPDGNLAEGYNLGIKAACSVLSCIPAADVAPVVHGEWIYKPLDKFRKYQVKCSNCDMVFIGNYDAYDEPSEFNYCPHCGARMDEVTK